jgi:hypothetical protein
VQRNKHLKDRHGYDSAKNKSKQVGDIATKLGLEREHKTLHKLFSKILHPTSYLVNSDHLMNDWQMSNTMFIHMQLYTLDTLRRVSDRLGAPDELLKPVAK